MTVGEIQRLEHEAEQSRRRLVENLARLRTNDQPSAVRRRISAEASYSKDELVGRAKQAARQRADGLVEGLKARIAANPGAAIAIGSGLAWRLYKHPPIATVLIGAGLVSLLRTSADETPASERIAAGAANLTDTLRAKMHDLRDVDARAKTGHLAHAAQRKLGEAAHSLGERLDALVDVAAERIGEWSEQAGDATRSQWRSASRTADTLGRKGREALARHAPQARRDQYLLGAAALALIAAVGIASQRRAKKRNGAQSPPRLEASGQVREAQNASRRPRATKRGNGKRTHPN